MSISPTAAPRWARQPLIYHSVSLYPLRVAGKGSSLTKWLMARLTKKVCVLVIVWILSCILFVMRYRIIPMDLPDPLTEAAEAPLRDWKEGTFCYDFLVNTFQQNISVCSSTSHSRDSIKCTGNPHSRHMATCVMENIIVSPHYLRTALLDPDHLNFSADVYPIALLDGVDTRCLNMTTKKLEKHVEDGDYILEIMRRIHHKKRDPISECEGWVNETVLFFTAHRFHIYFRLLDYFNLHKIVEDMSHVLLNNYRIIRISGSDNYHFPEFDQDLFPGVKVQSLDDFNGKSKLCFKKVILVPKSYASVLFQCKMQVSLRDSCMHCNGSGLTETQINRFRKRVINACSLTENKVNHSVFLISRTPYLRNGNDRAENFERVMSNENSLISELRMHFNNSIVQLVHLENMSLCEQVSLGYYADVYIGVHGSGLVHLWWMREDALIYELEPYFEVGNPTFRMLSRLSGRNYIHSFIGGGWRTVHANINEVLNMLEKNCAVQSSINTNLQVLWL